MNADRPIPEAVEMVREDIDHSDMQRRDDELAAFLVQCWPTLNAQNN